MEVKIKADTTSKQTTIILFSKNLDTCSFVDLIIGDERYTIELDELISAISLFEKNRELAMKREKHLLDIDNNN